MSKILLNGKDMPEKEFYKKFKLLSDGNTNKNKDLGKFTHSL